MPRASSSDVIAPEIVDSLEAALAQFGEIYEEPSDDTAPTSLNPLPRPR